jgi:hypothetical protein
MPGRGKPGGCYPARQRFRDPRIGKQRRQIIRPQRQIAARQILGLVHPTKYSRGAALRHAFVLDRSVFDAALAAICCIVVQ